jgi:hypothetical protein
MSLSFQILALHIMSLVDNWLCELSMTDVAESIVENIGGNEKEK